MGKKKLSYEYVYNFFKNNDCELLENEYINCDTKIKYRCKCGNISYIRFNDFRQGQRCMECSGNKQLTYEYVVNYFMDNNCELLENEYKNNRTKMKYRCECGNISYITFYNFQIGKRCKKCAGLEKLSYEYVKQYFIDHGCKLLEDSYINNHTKMKYECSCGNISRITFHNFQNEHRCKVCSESKAEKRIANYLNGKNIVFEREYKFNNCRNVLLLPFDFAIFNNNNLIFVIEYDGILHYKANFGEESFQKLIINDQIKTKYCQDNGISLLRIPYWDFENIESILDSYFIVFENTMKLNKLGIAV